MGSREKRSSVTTTPAPTAHADLSACPEADYLLLHGTLRTAPRVYADLFYPIYEYLAAHTPASSTRPPALSGGSTSTAAREPVAGVVEGGDVRGGSGGSGRSVAARAAELKRLALPKVAAAHLASYPLLSVSAATPTSTTTTAAATAVVGAGNGRGHVRSSDHAERGRGEGAGEGGRDGRKRPRSTVGDEGAGEGSAPDLRAITAALASAAVVDTYLGPYTSDGDYLRGVDVRHVLAHWRESTEALSLPPAHVALTARAGVDIVATLIPAVAATVEVYVAHVQHRLAGMARVPRVLRLANRLHLTQRETDALVLLLVFHYGSLLAATVQENLTLSTIAYYARLSPQESMRFVSAQRLHVRQGLIVSDGQTRNNFVESRYAMSQESVTALTGNDLAEEEVIKLERTALAEVLAEERRERAQGRGAGAGHTRAGADASPDPHDRTRGGEGESEDGGDSSDPSPDASEGETDTDTLAAVVAGEAVPHTGADPASLPTGHAAAMDAVEALVEAVGERTAGAAAGSSASAAAAAPVSGTPTAPTSRMHEPYTTDFEYMGEAFKTLASLIRLRAAEGDMKDEDDNYVPRSRIEATMRELKGRLRVSMAVHASRVAATLARAEKASADAAESATEPFVPRIEQLARRLGLSEKEKQVMLLMVGSVVSHDILVAINGRYVIRDGQQRYLTVGYLLFVLCDSLEERVAARRLFYRSAPLIADGILSLGLDGSGPSRSQFNTDLMDYVCDVDRKIVDYLMGSEAETAEMVPGSSLCIPTVPLENVVLPPQTTKLVLSTIEHYSMFQRCKVACGFGEGLGTMAGGLAMLFHGPSGTGKTMLANAVARELKKRLLLVNVSQFKSEQRAAEMMRFIFREAKLNDAIIFFDECESLFETRERNPLVTSVLTEFEKNDGLIIMATNMAQVMDEAMNRRISLMVEFKLPSHPMREDIWRRHIPRGLPLAPDVSIESLALNYELSGGLIRNAVLAALNHAVARENTERPTLSMADLEEGARLQLRGFFLAATRPGAGGGGGGDGSASGGGGGTGVLMGSEVYVTPRRSLSELVMEPAARRRVVAIVQLAKSRSTLFSQWGFSEEGCQDQGSIYLFSGPSGTGKSLAAEGIAYECGATIRLCNISELLLLRELNVAAVFEEGRRLGAVIVFDAAQELFTASERAAHLSRLIQYYAVRYPRPVIVIATTGSGGGAAAVLGGGGEAPDRIDVRATRLVFADHVSFRLPDRALRRQLWRSAFPTKVPLAADVDFDKLSEAKVSARVLRRVAFTVCCQAAAVGGAGAEAGSGAGTVSMKMIEDELARCILAEEQLNPARMMYV